MRQTMVGLAVALAVAVSAAPASACGYAGCSSPSWNYNYSGFYGNYSTPVAPCSPCGGWAGRASWGYSHLPYPAQPYATLPQYYWVNQGPTYTGPGSFAPYPAYEEDAVPVARPYRYGYYEGAGVEGPAVYGHRWHHYRAYHYGYARHYSYHFGPYYYGHRVLRRYY